MTLEGAQLTARDPNIEADVRSLVRSIVDGLLDEPSIAPVDLQDGAVEVPIESSHPTFPVSSVAVGGDHGGYAMKEKLAFKLRELGLDVVDCGTDSTEAVDYPDIAAAVGRQVASGKVDAGVIVDGAGIGSCMAANKIAGVRAALCYDLSTARNAREHNHANVVTLGAGLIGEALAWQVVEEFIATPYGDGRHARRVEKITELERMGS
jgi:ribose 5-phosphate isomerase B